jgi:hypothetical protein
VIIDGADDRAADGVDEDAVSRADEGAVGCAAATLKRQKVIRAKCKPRYTQRIDLFFFMYFYLIITSFFFTP